MSTEGCRHGPTYLTGGPDSCPDCLKEADAKQDSLKDEIAALENKISSAQRVTDMNEFEERSERVRAEIGRLWQQGGTATFDILADEFRAVALAEAGRTLEWAKAYDDDLTAAYLRERIAELEGQK